jgi:hypothetical protein
MSSRVDRVAEDLSERHAAWWAPLDLPLARATAEPERKPETCGYQVPKYPVDRTESLELIEDPLHYCSGSLVRVERHLS